MALILPRCETMGLTGAECWERGAKLGHTKLDGVGVCLVVKTTQLVMRKRSEAHSFL